jgi:hypothetical protein
MTQKVRTFFGLKLEVQNEPEGTVLAKVRQLLEKHLAAERIEVPKGASVYVKQLKLHAEDFHFMVHGIQNRLAKLRVDAALTPTARTAKTLRLVDLKYTLDPAVNVERKADGIRYELTGDYVQKHDEHTEYLAIVLAPTCRDCHKRLQVRVRAQATAEFAKKLKNVKDGVVTTGLEFLLSSSQLAFNFP